ncbi:DUF4166 domain-containing protein [Metapseudomonas otitidis]|uniref:DUF4166 domain-containing protein n=1 Tax=Metapseudomonas otitidis TaxID=319939 RepID=UPI001AAFB51C|nr:DUF4166 domain-containing protein [Pseudomonas otitidis]MBO2926973.1 DUF4166 domain-containing protein [Pseudomonas otitidis]
MSTTATRRWFGDRFSELHPQLQHLHSHGGRLRGEVTITYGQGLAGVLGRRLAKKMRFPGPGAHRLDVTIAHQDAALLWSRSFDGQAPLTSHFAPVGCLAEGGHWVESTGPLRLLLTVDVIDGGWFWRCLGIRLWGLPLPRALLPRTDAYKRIEAGRYRFHVAFSLPLLGPLVTYEGLLEAAG